MKFGTDISFAENLPEDTRHKSQNRLEGGFLSRIEFGCGEVGPEVSVGLVRAQKAEAETLNTNLRVGEVHGDSCSPY